MQHSVVHSWGSRGRNSIDADRSGFFVGSSFTLSDRTGLERGGIVYLFSGLGSVIELICLQPPV